MTSLLVFLLFIFYMFSYTEGRASPPLDDSFIHYQFAKMIARGHPFAYNSVDGYTKGATSFLFPVFLAPFYLIGLRGLWPFGVAVLLGVGALYITAVYTRRLLLSLGANQQAADTAGFLVILNGPLVWGYLSGMEIGPFCALLVVFLYYVISEKAASSCITGVLLVLTRPEGIVVATIAWLSRILKRSAPASRALLVPILVGLVPCTIHLLLTGDPKYNGLIGKSYLWKSDAYTFPWTEICATAGSRLLRAVHGGLADQFCGYLPVLPILLGLLGISSAVAGEENPNSPRYPSSVSTFLRRPHLLIAIVFSALLIVPSVIFTGWWHHYRYLMPAGTLMVVFIGLGLDRVGYHTSGVLARGCSILLIVSSAAGLPYWGYVYGKNASEVLAQDVAAAVWLKDQAPQFKYPAIFDVGAIPYLSDRRSLDLLGLTTEGVVRWSREGEGSLFEKFERLEELPDLLIVHDHWFPNLWDVVAGQELTRFVVPDPEIVTTQVVRIREFDGSLLKSGQIPFMESKLQGYTLVDEVDVADLVSERTHRYRIQLAYPDQPPTSLVGRFSIDGRTMADGGRAIIGSESFDVTVPKTGEFLLVIRTNRASQRYLEVTCNGVQAVTIEAPPADGFVELSCVLMRRPDTAPTVRLNVSQNRDDDPYHPFESYHYWIYQPM